MLKRLRDSFKRRPALELQIRTLEEMLILTPAAFELAVCDLLADMGFRSVKRVGGAGDLSVDITARDERGKSVGVQCKRYAPGNRVGSRDVQQFIGMTVTHHKVDRKLYVTTSGFTRSAVDLARKHGIELVDGDKLTRLLLEQRGAPTESPASEGEQSITELLELAAAGVIDMDKINFQLDPSVLAEIPELTEEELAEMQEWNESDARAGGVPYASSTFNAGGDTAAPIDCFRCGGTMTWDTRYGGYHCPNCGRRVAFDGTDFRVINTGDATAPAAERGPHQVPAGPQQVSPQGYTTPALPYTAPDGSQWLMAPPLDMAKVCENCGQTMEAVWSLPGYHCWSCGRSEMYADATTLTVLTPGAQQPGTSA